MHVLLHCRDNCKFTVVMFYLCCIIRFSMKTPLTCLFVNNKGSLISRKGGRVMETARTRIKEALVKLLDTNEFSRISVTQICREAGLSRVTFYLWYDNKDTMLNDYFQDIVNEGMEYFHELKNKSESDTIRSDFNALLETLFYLGNRYNDFVSHMVGTKKHEDQILYSRFNSIVMKQVSELIREHAGQIAQPLTLTEAGYFLSSGLGSMIRQDLDDGIAPRVIHEHASALLNHVLSSGLFSEAKTRL